MQALPPVGRTTPWLEEARLVLNRLKGELKVAKYVIAQVWKAVASDIGLMMSHAYNPGG